MLKATVVGYLASLFFYLTFVIATQAMGQPSDSVATVYFFIFVGLFDAPHIYHTWVRTHVDKTEYNRRPFFHWAALIVPIGLSVLAFAKGYGDLFNLLLGLYGGWHITRQSIGLQRFLGNEKKLVNERLIYAIYFYFLFHNAASSKDLWDTFLNPTALLFFQFITAIALFIFSLQFLRKRYKSFQSDDYFTLLTVTYFFVLTHADIHPLLITAMATIAHNVQYQVWMWNYENKFFSKIQAILSLLVCMLIGVLTAIVPEEGIWNYISQAYLGFVLWHYFIDGYIWRLSECSELKALRMF